MRFYLRYFLLILHLLLFSILFALSTPKQLVSTTFNWNQGISFFFFLSSIPLLDRGIEFSNFDSLPSSLSFLISPPLLRTISACLWDINIFRPITLCFLANGPKTVKKIQFNPITFDIAQFLSPCSRKLKHSLEFIT